MSVPTPDRRGPEPQREQRASHRQPRQTPLGPPVPGPRTRSNRAAPRTGRSTEPDEALDPAQRPYGSWYPLVRVGHFFLMATTSCLIIMVGLGVLGLLIYLFLALTK